MILIAGVHDPDIERVKALTSHEFPAEQIVIDRAFATGELTVPEWSKAVQNLAAEQVEPWGFGSAISAGFFSGYLTLFPSAAIVIVRSDPVAAIAGTEAEGYDSWAVARGIVMGYNSIENPLQSVPHVVIDMRDDPSDDEVRAALIELERAA